jgi:hypothetical protein
MTHEHLVFVPESEWPDTSRCPVGWTFAYQASLWTVKGVLLAQSPSGARGVLLIVGQEPEPSA